MPQPPTSHHFALDDDARKMMEQSAFNYWTLVGRPMRIPVTLYDDLRTAGVSLRYMEADASLGILPPSEPQ